VKLSDMGDVSSMQPDGSPPTIVTGGTAPGESGVAVADLRYQGGHSPPVSPTRAICAAG
jgi:hypothetical protein